MSHVVWLDGALVPAASAALPITDPGVRWGDGLFQTMRAQQRRVPLLGRHLKHLSASARTLGMLPVPSEDEVANAVRTVVAQIDEGVHRVRITVTTRPTLLVEATPYLPTGGTGVAVASLRGSWCPGNKICEHKTLSYAGHRLAHRRAQARGADHALLVDDRGRLGESDAANVLVVIAGTLVTPPVEGILSGVTRELLLEAAAAVGIVTEVRHMDEPEWRGADEMLLSNALAGVTPVVAIDGVPVGDGAPGPVGSRLTAGFARCGGWLG